MAHLLGHATFNLLLQAVTPTVVSVALLFEIVGASVIAALLLNQRPSLMAVPAAALIAAGPSR